MFTVTQVSDILDITPHALHFYDNEGLYDEFIFWRLSEAFIPANFKPISTSEKLSMFHNIHLIINTAERRGTHEG